MTPSGKDYASREAQNLLFTPAFVFFVASWFNPFVLGRIG